ncbi:hypothetical protein CHS0354_030901 [Potamilus streckersoni]|uniref:Uncharacterized protein n=1 Tax=Potamilus streckersoni TaxID=2493646 RepID=A0AAE0RK97_9BIVA|nr:hypothetical protein CHS0354_030901 [Potamilus streckersoni]
MEMVRRNDLSNHPTGKQTPERGTRFVKKKNLYYITTNKWKWTEETNYPTNKTRIQTPGERNKSCEKHRSKDQKFLESETPTHNYKHKTLQASANRKVQHSPVREWQTPPSFREMDPTISLPRTRTKSKGNGPDHYPEPENDNKR